MEPAYKDYALTQQAFLVRHSSFSHQEGILYEQSCIHTPQQNGIVECKNINLLAINRVFVF